MNKKEFTIGELFIVIIIFSIIIFLIPKAIKKYNDAKNSEIKSYSLRYIEAIEYYADYLQIHNEKVIVKKCVREKNSWKTKECKEFYDEIDKQTSAKTPSDATIEIDDKGRVKYNSVFTYEGRKYIYK